MKRLRWSAARSRRDRDEDDEDETNSSAISSSSTARHRASGRRSWSTSFARIVVVVLSRSAVASSFVAPTRRRASSWTAASVSRIDVDEDGENGAVVERLHSDPDVLLYRDFLAPERCRALVDAARGEGLDRSPVAYAGRTEDAKELLDLALRGPVVWVAILAAWWEVRSGGDGGAATTIAWLSTALRDYVVAAASAAAAVAAFVEYRERSLRSLRTSSSTTLDDLDRDATRAFVERAARLFDAPREDGSNDDDDDGAFRRRAVASRFEAPTVIRYEPGQALAPHFDANRAAETEDAHRGGQTLATLLLYLNDVETGGATAFGRLTDARGEPLTVRPRAGDALLFFPADARGAFDDRTEHEGRPAVDEKWIARIWRHANDVPPPFGLSDAELDKLFRDDDDNENETKKRETAASSERAN